MCVSMCECCACRGVCMCMTSGCYQVTQSHITGCGGNISGCLEFITVLACVFVCLCACESVREVLIEQQPAACPQKHLWWISELLYVLMFSSSFYKYLSVRFIEWKRHTAEAAYGEFRFQIWQTIVLCPKKALQSPCCVMLNCEQDALSPNVCMSCCDHLENQPDSKQQYVGKSKLCYRSTLCSAINIFGHIACYWVI